ncbi:neutral and basic amino acid transport protein rBAT-like isoform X2 [Athalia rosae]|uniref:neutral and basic amino acid transport protein rBAT-like isoform X2 n=1 Tax=Athalia rosae TaxID=37344 RepID=UPI00203352DD|nr:neutral and basic amino acid transport protein rBAT-like isoform X2 [Athalia rosae]
MNIQKPESLLSVVLPGDLLVSPSSQELLTQDEETSDCPLLTPSPPPGQMFQPLENAPMFNPLEGAPLEMGPAQTLGNFITEDGLNGYINMVALNSSSKPINDEPSSRDPMVESSSSSASSSGDNEPVCTQLLTQLNTAYQHLAPDAQALENGGKPPLVGIQLAVQKSPKDYRFMAWNWPLIRKACFWSFMSFLAGCVALVVGVIATMPKRCDPPVEWWQGSVFYEIFPASFKDSSTVGDGIGDFKGIAAQLDYLSDLGVQVIRLNSIFPAQHYPEHYRSITSLLAIQHDLGTIDDFNALVLAVHRRNMSLVLDLPLYPYVENFGAGGNSYSTKPNKRDKEIRERRDAGVSVLPNVLPTPEPTSFESIRNILSSVPPPVDPKPNAFLASALQEPEKDHVVTAAIKFWLQKNVDGFYLKGLEHYAKEKNFAELVKYWKFLVGPNRILICNSAVLANVPQGAAKNVILDRIDLIDVTLNFSNGTTGIKSQVNSVLNGILFEKPGYPWIHWSIGGVDTSRIASSLSVSNASIAASLLGMMLPGTPNIFYGDEIGMVDCDCEDHRDLEHVHNLMPMLWEGATDKGDGFSSTGAIHWLLGSTESIKTTLVGAIRAMSKLRSETPTIYMNGVYKDHQINGNCEIRYTDDELLVVERRYPRRNSYVLVANFGAENQTKDLSSLYYGGYIVVGATNRVNNTVYFKELNIFPGEAFVIKLDK